MTGAITKVTSPYLDEYVGFRGFSEKLTGAVLAGIVDGMVSELSGGKFSIGTITGVFANLYNQVKCSNPRGAIADKAAGIPSAKVRLISLTAKECSEELSQQLKDSGDYAKKAALGVAVVGSRVSPSGLTLGAIALRMYAAGSGMELAGEIPSPDPFPFVVPEGVNAILMNQMVLPSTIYIICAGIFSSRVG